VKIDAVLEKHHWDEELWLWSIGEIHNFVFLSNAWPSVTEQEAFTTELLHNTPHASDVSELLSKVIFSNLGISEHIWVFHIQFSDTLILQFDREISQSRSKSKEKCMAHLDSIFPGIDISVPSDVSDKRARNIRQEKLLPLKGLEGSPNPPFIYIPPEWALDDENKIKVDQDGKNVMAKPPRRPFFSPYILGVFKVLWFGENARWKDLDLKKITASQLAFVCGLVSYYLGFFCMFWK
jgi:hypothetical protein